MKLHPRLQKAFEAWEYGLLFARADNRTNTKTMAIVIMALIGMV